MQELRVPGGGFYWRVAMDFRWYVGGRQVGRVVNEFDRGGNGWGEYFAGHNAQLANLGTKYFCKML